MYLGGIVGQFEISGAAVSGTAAVPLEEYAAGGVYLRAFVYAFIEAFAPTLDRAAVDAALGGGKHYSRTFERKFEVIARNGRHFRFSLAL